MGGPGGFYESAGIHNTGMMMGVDEVKGQLGVSRRPFRARAGGGDNPGFRLFGSTLGYIPAAASRLKMFAIFPDLDVVHITVAPSSN